MQNLEQQINRTFEQIRVFEEEHGSILEAGSEFQRLKLLKKNYEIDLENQKKRNCFA